MDLEAFRASGIRCLAAIDWVPVARPTILTGPNDGGKSSLLLAIAFLLEGRGVVISDLTYAADGEEPSCGLQEGRYAACWAEGRFSLGGNELTELGLDAQANIRRRFGPEGATELEVLTLEPAELKLRGLSTKRLVELQQIAADLGIDPDGPANHRDSYVRPLEELAESQDKEPVWMPASREIGERLPRLIAFASTAEPSPEGEIHQALQEAYVQALEDSSIVGPVRAAEKKVRAKLGREAKALRTHIIERCPELSDLVVEPAVSFKEGFGGVKLSSTRKEGGSVAFSASGAGTRRRIALATWEWTRKLLTRGASGARSIVVAYDEPDTHLDYGHQRDLVDLIRRQCEIPGVRVVIATHSLNLIDKVSIEDVVHIELEHERTVIRRLFGGDHGAVDRHLVDIAASMGLRNSVLLHERCFVGVEGVTEQQAIPILFRTATGFTLQAAGIALIPAGGNAGARAFCKYLTEQGRQVRFIVDRDSAAHKIFAPAKLRAVGIGKNQMYLVGDPKEIEDLFTDAQWAAVAQSAWPRDDGSPWGLGHFAKLRKSGKFSDRLHDLLKSNSASAPVSKAALLPTLAETLTGRGDVPEALREVFEDLIRVTSLR